MSLLPLMSGQLNRKEFKAALKAAKLGLTQRDINLIMSSANKDGLISYEEFIPVCFQVQIRTGNGIINCG